MSLSVKCVFVATAVAMAGLAPASAEPRLILAQAGSTGGTIGKVDKSASGGEVSAPRRARRAPRVRIRYAAAQEQRAPRARKSSAAPRLAVGGRWNWVAACSLGNTGGVATLVQTTASTFHGIFGYVGPTDIITDGKIRGRHMSFRRNEGNGVVQRYDMDLASMEPPTVKGYHVHPVWGACQFTATKM